MLKSNVDSVDDDDKCPKASSPTQIGHRLDNDVDYSTQMIINLKPRSQLAVLDVDPKQIIHKLKSLDTRR